MNPRTRPDFFDAYVALDPGVVNRTAILFAYVDFMRDVLVVEGERFLRGPDADTSGIADAIHAMERTLWGEPNARKGTQDGRQPYKRVSDTDARLIMDLRNDHGLSFSPADKKGGPTTGVRIIRTMIKAKRLEVDASCRVLLAQMDTAIWNSRATDFAAEADKGHYDGIASLGYLVRAVNMTRNPFPASYRVPTRSADTRYRPPPTDTGLLPRTALGRRMAKVRR